MSESNNGKVKFNTYPERTELQENDVGLLWNSDTNAVNNFTIGTLLKIALAAMKGKISIDGETLKIE